MVRFRRNLEYQQRHAACFFRDAFGNATNIDPPGSPQTYAHSINDNSEVEGYSADSHQLYHGFLRDAYYLWHSAPTIPPRRWTAGEADKTTEVWILFATAQAI